MRKTTKVLALGEEEWLHTVRQALPRWYQKGFAGAHDFWTLCALPEPVIADVAIVHHSFAFDDLRYAAEYIRRRWPGAVIVVIGEQAKRLDDPLYDHRTASDIPLEKLVRLIENWVEDRQQSTRRARLAIGGALV